MRTLPRKTRMSVTLLEQCSLSYEAFRKTCVIALSAIGGDVQIRFGTQRLYTKYSQKYQGRIIRKVHRYFVHVRIHPRSVLMSLREYSIVNKMLFTKTLFRLEVPKEDKLEAILYLMDIANQA